MARFGLAAEPHMRDVALDIAFSPRYAPCDCEPCSHDECSRACLDCFENRETEWARTGRWVGRMNESPERAPSTPYPVMGGPAPSRLAGGFLGPSAPNAVADHTPAILFGMSWRDETPCRVASCDCKAVA